MTAEIFPFEVGHRDVDGILRLPPPRRTGTVYIFHGLAGPRQRKPRWFIAIEFCDSTHEIEIGPKDWQTAMFLARVRARKFGFRVVDLSNVGGGQ